MNTKDIYPEGWEENLPDDVKEKLDKGIISKKEAEILIQFHRKDQRNQILFEIREIEENYRKKEEKQFRNRFKDPIRNNIFENAVEARREGKKRLIIPDDIIEQEINEWVKVFVTPEEEEEKSPVAVRETKSKWEKTIRRWMKESIKEGIEMEKNHYINNIIFQHNST